MANICRNKVTIVGEPERVAELVAKAYAYPPKWGPEPYEIVVPEPEEKQHMCFHGLVPLPEGTHGPNVSYSNVGLTAESQTWGGKWGAYDYAPPVEMAPGVVTYEFSTAWSPATTFWTKVSKQFPDLLIIQSYSEESPSRGRILYHSGVCHELPDNVEMPDDEDEDEDEDGDWGCDDPLSDTDEWQEALTEGHEDFVRGLLTLSGDMQEVLRLTLVCQMPALTANVLEEVA